MFILSFFPKLVVALTIVVLAVIGILPDELIALLMPVIVWLATGFVNWLKATLGNSGFGGTVLTTMVVPALSLLLSFLGSLISPDLSFWQLFALGLLSVFINEVVKQWDQSVKGTQTNANKDLIG